MKTITPILISCFFFYYSFSQSLQVNKEAILHLEKPEKDNFLRNIFFETKGRLAIEYNGKMAFKNHLHTYFFDENLNLVEENDTILRAKKEQNDEDANLKVEHISVTVHQKWDGKLIANSVKEVFHSSRRQNYSYKKPLKELEIFGQKGERLHLYYQTRNSNTNDTYLVVGIKAKKGSKIRYQHARKFQILRVTEDLEIHYLQKIEFEYNTAIHYQGILSYNADADLADGYLALFFSPARSLFASNYISKNPENQRVVFVGEKGNVIFNIPYRAEVSGWSIDDFIFSQDGKSVFFYGPAQYGSYINEVIPTLTDLYTLRGPKFSAWKEYQIMKISNDQVDWISAIPIKTFKEKIVTPPAQKKKPYFKGKDLIISVAIATSNEEILIGGQLIDPGEEIDEKRNIVLEKNKYEDFVLFHFDIEGNLEAQYSITRFQKRKKARMYAALPDLILTPGGSSAYLIYQELHKFKFNPGETILGGKSSFNLKGDEYRMPIIHKIDLKNRRIGDLNIIRSSKNEPSKYFSKTAFPYILIPEWNSLIFLGEDMESKSIWLGKLKI